MVGTLLSSYIVAEAARLGAPGNVLGRMVLNVAVETLVGTIPVLGDLFDLAWKANQRNVRLLREHERDPRRATRRNRFVVGAVAIVAVAAFALLAWAVLEIVLWLWVLATAG